MQVLSEIDNPRKKYKWPAFFAVAGVCTLYILVNIAYVSFPNHTQAIPSQLTHRQFIVVPAELQIKGKYVDGKDVDVATEFFKLTFGTLSDAGNKIAPRVLAAFMAVSSLGIF